MIVQNPFVVGVTTVLVTSCWTRVTASIHQDAENSLLGDWMNNTESGYTVAQRLRHTASASLMHFPLVFKTVSDQADSVLLWLAAPPQKQERISCFHGGFPVLLCSCSYQLGTEDANDLSYGDS